MGNWRGIGWGLGARSGLGGYACLSYSLCCGSDLAFSANPPPLPLLYVHLTVAEFVGVFIVL